MTLVGDIVYRKKKDHQEDLKGKIELKHECYFEWFQYTKQMIQFDPS